MESEGRVNGISVIGHLMVSVHLVAEGLVLVLYNSMIIARVEKHVTDVRETKFKLLF